MYNFLAVVVGFVGVLLIGASLGLCDMLLISNPHPTGIIAKATAVTIVAMMGFAMLVGAFALRRKALREKGHRHHHYYRPLIPPGEDFSHLEIRWQTSQEGASGYQNSHQDKRHIA